METRNITSKSMGSEKALIFSNTILKGTLMLDKMSLSNFKELGDSYAVIVIARAADIEQTNVDIVREMMGKDGLCIYVSVNQPFSSMLRIMKKSGIDTRRIFFIDCITKTSGGTVVDADNCIYIDSTSNLTELNISISEALSAMEGKKSLFFDALSTLMIYNTPSSFAKFAHSVMTKVKSMGVSGIFMVVEGEMSKDIFSQLEQFSEKTIDLR